MVFCRIAGFQVCGHGPAYEARTEPQHPADLEVADTAGLEAYATWAFTREA